MFDDSDWIYESEDSEFPTNIQPFYDFDWRPELEYKIWKEHEIRPEEVEECFNEPDAIVKVRATGNEKFILYCHVPNGKYLFIVFAYKVMEGLRFIRIISARVMDASERKLYRRK